MSLNSASSQRKVHCERLVQGVKCGVNKSMRVHAALLHVLKHDLFSASSQSEL
jgi:hypothetical protein